MLLFFPIPTPDIWQKGGAPAAKYVSRSLVITYFIYLGINEWPWPIKLNANELVMFMAGAIDGDGTVTCFLIIIMFR
jgi:hypothetical protein